MKQMKRKVFSAIAILLCMSVLTSCSDTFQITPTQTSAIGVSSINIYQPSSSQGSYAQSWYDSQEYPIADGAQIYPSINNTCAISEKTSTGYYLVNTLNELDEENFSNTNELTVVDDIGYNNIHVISADDYSDCGIIPGIEVENCFSENIIVVCGMPYLEVCTSDEDTGELSSIFYPINTADMTIGSPCSLISADATARVIYEDFVLGDRTCLAAYDGANLSSTSAALYFLESDGTLSDTVDLCALLDEPVEEVESVVQFGEDSYLIKYRKTYELESDLCLFNYETNEISDVVPETFSQANSIYTDTDGKTYLSFSDGIYYYSRSTGTYTKKVDFGRTVDFDVSLVDAVSIVSFEDDTFILQAIRNQSQDDFNSSSVIELSLTDYPYVGREEVVVGVCGNVSESQANAIIEYNQSDSPWYVRTSYITTDGPDPMLDISENYTEEFNYSVYQAEEEYTTYLSYQCEYARALEGLLQSNDTPDVLFSNSCIIQLCNSSCLSDLNNLFNTSAGLKREDFFESVLELAEVDGALYQIPLSFSLAGITTDESSPDLAALYSSYASQFVDYDPISYSYSLQEYTELMLSNDYNAITSDPEVRYELIDFLLNYVYPQYMHNQSSTPVNLYNPLSETMFVTELTSLYELNSFASRNLNLCSFPSSISGGVTIDPNYLVAISSNSEAIYGAYSFVTFMLMSDSVSEGTEGSFVISSTEFEEEFESQHVIPRECYDAYLTYVESASAYLFTDPEFNLIFAQEFPALLDQSVSIEDLSATIIERMSAGD